MHIHRLLLRLPVLAAGATAGLMLVAEPAFAASVVTVPISPSTTTAGFGDIDVVAADDAWAVGGNGNAAAARYNGSRWAVVPTPGRRRRVQ